MQSVMKKGTIILSITTLLLLVSIGIGLWVLTSRQTDKSNKKPQDVTVNQSKEMFTMDEVSTHNSKTDCWTVISGQVYKLTDFINRHPGGDEILRACGTDATTLFDSRKTQDGQTVGSGASHSSTAKEQLERLRIGTIKNEEK